MRFILVFLTVLLFASSNCPSKLFTFRSDGTHPISLKSFVESLAVDNCHLNVVYSDDVTKKRLAELTVGKICVKNYTLSEFLDLLLGENNFFWEINHHKLRISYVQTKTFSIDYIPSTRTGSATFKASSSEEAGDINSVDSKYEFDFWGNFEKHLTNILNTTDTYEAKPPIIDKNAGLVTITATKKQIQRVAKYISLLNARLHKQIIIDVKIYSVDLSQSHKTGINWSHFNISLGSDDHPLSTRLHTNDIIGRNSIFSQAQFNISGLLDFLSSQGNVHSISNPKIATINNQKAIISVGDTINYKVMTEGASVDANGNQIPPTYTAESKFVGILLDITPEISDNGIIILRINPTISSFRDEKQLDDPDRELAPDTTDNKLSTVVRIKNNHTLVLGGLITNKDDFERNGIPILKELPIVKYLFSSKQKISQKKELVFVITPHIVDTKSTVTLKDLGFSNVQ
ncbi:MAG: type II protein secretion system D protein [Epsilonproteobacteria bacterium]|nr:type II protein secretion system D protein [Campylobacterota bacterium]